MCRFHDMAAAETEPLTCGYASEDDAVGVLAQWLAWARQPMVPLTPFATPYGPSTVFFYHNRSQGGGITNMTASFEWDIDEGDWSEMPNQVHSDYDSRNTTLNTYESS
jgi:hypothetical protein